MRCFVLVFSTWFSCLYMTPSVRRNDGYSSAGGAIYKKKKKTNSNRTSKQRHCERLFFIWLFDITENSISDIPKKISYYWIPFLSLLFATLFRRFYIIFVQHLNFIFFVNSKTIFWLSFQRLLWNSFSFYGISNANYTKSAVGKIPIYKMTVLFE